jgi:hypothetical protein
VAVAVTLALIAVIAGLALSTSGARRHDGHPSIAVPPLYLGLDSYLHWDKLPYLEIGDRVAGQSTADPVGSNNDSVNILDTRADGGRVLFDQIGPGVVTFLRMQEAFGGPWRLTRDGHTETITGAGLGGDSGSPLPYPLSLTNEQSRGSSILATPLPYADRLTFESTAPNGNFYSMYRKLPVDAPLPRWDAATTRRVAELLAGATGNTATGNTATGNTATGNTATSSAASIAPGGVRQRQGTVTLGPAGTSTLVTTITGRHAIRAITFRVPFSEKVRFGNARLRCTGTARRPRASTLRSST